MNAMFDTLALNWRHFQQQCLKQYIRRLFLIYWLCSYCRFGAIGFNGLRFDPTMLERGSYICPLTRPPRIRGRDLYNMIDLSQPPTSPLHG
jgi:hypothetical protein